MNEEIENSSPYLSANVWSRLFHGWVSPLLLQSRQEGTLQVSDLYNIPPDLKSRIITDKLEANWYDEVKRYSRKASLFRATIRTMGWTPFLLGLLLLIKELLNISQPLLLIFLMNYFESCSTMPVWQAWILGVSTVLIAFVSSIVFNQAYYHLQVLALEMRVAYMGLVFRKVLRLSSYSLNKTASGQITNLLSNDASQIEMALLFFNHLWLSPVEIGLVVYFFWYFIKYISFVAIGYTLFLFGIQILLGRIFLHFRNQILRITDERVKIMSEIITSIRVIKMYCWESANLKKIRHVRKREIIQCVYRGIFECIQFLSKQTYVILTFLMIYSSMWSLNFRFNTQFFAVASCLFPYMRSPIVEFFSIAAKTFVNYMSAQRRIQTFLLLDQSERDDRLLSRTSTEASFNEQKGHLMSRITSTIGPTVHCNVTRAQWEKDSSFCLDSILFNAQAGDLVCIVGPVGAGKSSLLQTLTGEIAFFDGRVRLNGSFCYVPQQSWIFSSTVKENILFGKEYDHELFQRVVQSTALHLDFSQLSNGELTVVGDQGAMLSGGQKARVNLARSLYRNADIYLLDDPLSSVDVKVAKHIFEKTIKGYLSEKICILVTHQIQLLENVKKILLLYNGEVAGIGSYNELLHSSLLFAHLLDDSHRQEKEKEKELSIDLPEEEEEEEEEDRSIDLCHENAINSSIVSERENVSLFPLSTVETKAKGRLKAYVYIEYFRAGAGILIGLLLLTLISITQQGIYVFGNYWLARWNDEEGYRYQNSTNCTNNQQHSQISSMTDDQWIHHRNERFYYFCGIVLIFVLVALFRTFAIQLMFINASRVLHNKMFQRVIRAPIIFFDTNPVGRILNRFTKDVSIMDDYLPSDASDFLDCCLQVLGVLVLVSCLHPWSVFPSLICSGGLLFVRYRFAPTSRDLKRIEGITRSPVYSHLSSTIQGIKVVRSYRAEDLWLNQFEEHLDNNTRANHLIITTNRWAAIRFDWVALVFIGLVTLSALILRVAQYHHFSPGEIALVLSYSLSLMALLQWTIRQSVVVETQMTSVERVVEYCSLDQEPPSEVSLDLQPPLNWPSEGEIIFDNISMCYSSQRNSRPQLRQISMRIKSGEKVGIVGRTGAGKTSLMQTLFRMGTIIQGQIRIDNIDISSIGLDDLRRRISIIPQDPVLFTGTIRTNLDPFEDHSDEDIWNTLEQVQLKTLVATEMSNGLHAIVDESGANLSFGQKQLLCLARAILKQSKILIIDEATANVDNATDELIQSTIREKFKQCTVLTVAHRLRTVIDSDRIMVLGQGELLEFDIPDVLLSNPTSHFNILVEQSGIVEAKHLRALARAKSSQSNVDDSSIDNGTNINT